ncbi:ExbD/TolR family protein [Pontibacter sp. JAM-7]|uniref:ExbD/TolR family protein n=1 Tax=Pontibacter sp. JAM-7 TaxID=3366581 RepID=UPI003AF8A0AE
MMIPAAQKPSTLGNDDNLIPLINVVFLMLIFFMVAGHIQTSDPANIQLPESQANTDNDQQRHELLIDAAGNCYLDGNLVAHSLLENPLNQLASSRSDSSLPLLVKADAQLPVSQLQQRLRLVHAAGIQRISLATRLITGVAP